MRQGSVSSDYSIGLSAPGIRAVRRTAMLESLFHNYIVRICDRPAWPFAGLSSSRLKGAASPFCYITREY